MVVYNEINIKLVLLGSGGVGKTSLVHSFFNEKLPDEYYPTIGSLINKRQYKLEEKEILINLNIWDVGGQRSFNPLNPMFFQNTDIAFLVFDVFKPENSLNEIKNVFLPNLLEKSEESIIFLMGNKIDKDFNQENLIDKVRKNSLSDIPLMLASAKTRENVEQSFEFIIYSYLKENKEILTKRGIENLSDYFLLFLGKNEEDIINSCFNLDDISSIKLQKQKAIDIKKKKIDTRFEEVEDFGYLLENLPDMGHLKEEIKKSFQKNISYIEDMIGGLGKTPIHLLMETIEETKIHLNALKEDFEQKLDLMLNMENILSKKNKDLTSNTKEKMVKN